MSVEQPVLHQPGQANPQRALVLFVCVPLAAFLTFGLTLALDYPSDRYAMIGLALLTISIASIPVILDQARSAERRHVLLTFYCFLFMGHFGLPIFTHYAVVRMPTNPPGVSFASLLPADVVAGQFVALIGLVSFLIGYALIPSRMSDEDIERRKARDWPPSVIPVVAAMMLVLGWTFTISGRLGLIPAALGSGVVSTIASSVIFGNALLAVAAIRHRSRIAWIMLFIAVPFSSALGFFTGSKRATLIFPAMVLFTGMLLGGRIRARWIIVGAAALMMLYPINEFYRRNVLEGQTFTVVDALSDPTYTLGVLSDFVSNEQGRSYLTTGLASTAARLDAIGIESVIVRDTPTVSPFQHGRTLGLFFAAFVPRLLWPSKPSIAIGRWITSTYGTGAHVASHTGPSFMGDLYLNFGIPSVLFGMLTLGALLRAFHNRFLGPYPTTVGVLAATIVLAQIAIKQMGSAAHVLSSTVFAFAPVFLVYLAVPFFTGSARAPMLPSWSEQDDGETDVGSE